MTAIATDAFTEGSNTALTSHTAGGITWVNNNGAFLVVAATDTVRSNSAGTETGAHDSTNVYPNDQYAKMTCAVAGGGALIGVAVRCHASAATWYEYYGDTTATYMAKMVTGSWTQIGSNGAAIVGAHIYELDVVGTTLTPKKDGATADIGAQTDSSIASGSAGVSGYAAAATQSTGDDWEGGSIATANVNLLAGKFSMKLAGKL